MKNLQHYLNEAGNIDDKISNITKRLKSFKSNKNVNALVNGIVADMHNKIILSDLTEYIEKIQNNIYNSNEKDLLELSTDIYLTFTEHSY